MGPPQGTGWIASKTAGTTEPISVAGLRELETGENAADSAISGSSGSSGRQSRGAGNGYRDQLPGRLRGAHIPDSVASDVAGLQPPFHAQRKLCCQSQPVSKQNMMLNISGVFRSLQSVRENIS